MASCPNHQCTFNLDKAYFRECYQESRNADYSPRAYFKAAILILLGVGLVLFTDVNDYAAWFVFALGIIEVLGVKYQEPWWVTRQMLSRAAKADVELVVDNEGFHLKSHYHEQDILWKNIDEVQATDKGWLIFHEKTKYYMSNSYLSDEVIAYIKGSYQ